MDLSKYTNRLRQLQEDARAELRRIREDGDLSAEAKARRAGEVQSRLREQYHEERQRVNEQLEGERTSAYRRAHPVEGPGSDTQAEILKELRRQRVERDLFREWDQSEGGPRLAGYEDAVARGDEDLVAAYERYGPEWVPSDGSGAEFVRRVRENQRERMPDDQRRAVGELEELDQARLELGISLGFLDRTTDEISTMGPAGVQSQQAAI